LGVPAGETPQRFRFFFILVDQLDSAFGFILVYYFFIDISISMVFTLLIIFPFVALIIKRLLFILKLKKHYH
jgi:CDP-diacylglycerol--serine O-phosphatidyltransferase